MENKHQSGSEFMEISAQAFLFLKKYIVIIVIFIVAGVVMGYINNKKQVTTYSKRIVVSSGKVPYELVNALTVPLQLLIDDNNYKALSQNLNIKEELARKISKIRSDSVSRVSRFYFVCTFNLGDTALNSVISNGYINYLKNNEYVKTILSENKEKYEELISKSEQKLRQLDNIQYKAEGNAAQQLSGSYEEYIKIYDSKLNYQESLRLKNDIKIIQENLTVLSKRSALSRSLIIMGAAFFFLSIILCVVIEFFRRLKQYMKK
jgi:preprotein translocase subunit SecG